MNVRSLFRNLTKDRLHFLINLLGMVLSISLIILLLSYAFFSLRTDKHIPDLQNVGLVANSSSSLFTSYPMEGLCEENFPEVLAATTVDYISVNKKTVLSKENHEQFEVEMIAATPGFFEVFGLQALQGSVHNLLEKPGSIAISQHMAQRMFGNSNPIGQTVFYDQKPLSVEAVIENNPKNSTTTFNVVGSFYLKDLFYPGKYYENNWDLLNFHLFVRCTNQEALTKLETDLPRILNENKKNTSTEEESQNKLSVLGLQEVFFMNNARDYLHHGNKQNILMLISAALAVLFMAVMNYVNLTTAQTAKRIKSISIHKITGANRWHLIARILSESSFIVMLSTLLSIAISHEVIGICNRSGKLLLDPFLTNSFSGIALLFSGALVIGIISGIYPALTLTGLNPAKTVFAEKTVKTKGQFFRDILTISQFSIAILLIVFTLIVKTQKDFLLHSNPGFDKQSVLYIDTYQGTENINPTHLASTLRKLPEIEYCSPVSSSLGELETIWGTNLHSRKGAKHVAFFTILAGRDYPQVLGLEYADLFSRPEEFPDSKPYVLINEKAYREFGLQPEDIGTAYIESFSPDKHTPVSGVLKDFNYHLYHQEIKPLGIVCMDLNRNMGTLALRINTASLHNTQNLIRKIKSIWDTEVPDKPLKYKFLDNHLASLYEEEVRFNRIFSLFVVVSLTIACLGILGLSAFIAEQRRKEIAIRKVNGATISSVLRLLTGRFVLRIGIAFALAAPAAWYIAGKWLQNYAYHTQPSWHLWLIGLLMAATVALATTWTHTWRAATLNPAKSLKYE